MNLPPDIQSLNEEVTVAAASVDALVAEVSKVIVGQRSMVERIVVGMLCGEHILLEGVPGLAKTLAVNTFAHAISGSFARVQFTPDLLPADLVGTLIFDQKTGEFNAKKGPLFANLVLADEINRAPAKVQSALLEAMQEHQITLGDHTFVLPKPFLVFATQNPIEQQGTYPLPEAQVDRFMLKLRVSYPSRQEEREIIRRYSGGDVPEVRALMTPERIMELRQLVRRIYVDEKITSYILDIVFATREPAALGMDFLAPLINLGASPRASLYLTAAAKAYAFLNHRGFVIADDVHTIAPDVLRHRIIGTYEAEAEGMTSDDIVARVLEKVQKP
ncbi:MoxR family ATPase [bacterium]|nr:MoxR family ATPase [bacterium]